MSTRMTFPAPDDRAPFDDLSAFRETRGAIDPAALLHALLDSLKDPLASQPSQATAAAALVHCERIMRHLRPLAMDSPTEEERLTLSCFYEFAECPFLSQ